MNSAVGFASTDVKSNIMKFYIENSSVWTMQTLKFQMTRAGKTTTGEPGTFRSWRQLEEL